MTSKEALERYHNGDVLVSKADSRYEDEYLILEDNEEYQTIKRELKALEIIKNKRIDVDYFLTIIEKYNELEKQMKAYNHLNCVYEMLTQEEYELLKEVLEE